MKLERTQGVIIMAIGVAALNVVYLWDMIVGTHEGMIYIGTFGWGGVVIANVAIVACLVAMARRE